MGFLALWQLALVSLVVLGGSIITTVTGMAGGVIILSAINLFFPARDVVQIHGVVSIFANGSRSVVMWRHLRWNFLTPFFIGATVSILFTSLILKRIQSDLLPLVTLSILTVLVLYTLLKPKKMPKLEIKPKNFFWVGLGTGTLGLLAGAIDPLLGAFFIRDDLTKEEIVCNKSSMQLFTHFSKSLVFLSLGFNFKAYLLALIVLAFVAVLGSWIGTRILPKINKNVFFTLMQTALWLAVIQMLYKIGNLLGYWGS